MKAQYKAGDLVRVGGHARYGVRVEGRGPRHHIKSGTVCTVVVDNPEDGDITVRGPECMQVVGKAVVKLAKQAMRKRGEYADRRG